MDTLKQQLLDTLQRCEFFAEYELSNDEFLVVNYGYDEKNHGVYFELNINLDDYTTHFSGEVLELENRIFSLPFEFEYFENLDHYLEQISQEINEGFLIPNNLFKDHL